MIPLEIFLKDILTNRIENSIIFNLQNAIDTNSMDYFANIIMNMSDMTVFRYIVYLLYLSGDAILATKTAILAFYG
jgi:hypothetical protein